MISWRSYGLTVQVMLMCHSYSDRVFAVLFCFINSVSWYNIYKVKYADV
jgi:hypothetical protein